MHTSQTDFGPQSQLYPLLTVGLNKLFILLRLSFPVLYLPYGVVWRIK